jgi:hypothetical protein
LGFVLIGEDENYILDCYRLAKYYHTDPRVFIEMPLSEVSRHLRWTIKLAKTMREEARDPEDD